MDVKEEVNLTEEALPESAHLKKLETAAAVILSKCQEKCREWSITPPADLSEVPAKLDEISAAGHRAVVQRSQALAFRTRLRSHLDLVVADLESTFNLTQHDNVTGPITPVTASLGTTGRTPALISFTPPQKRQRTD